MGLLFGKIFIAESFTNNVVTLPSDHLMTGFMVTLSK